MNDGREWPLSVPLTDQLRREIAAINWWHHIPLGGVRTPGRTSEGHQNWISDHLPTDLRGQSVLDIGAWDGYFSFLAEHRGARRVIAIDELQNPQAHDSGTQGFELARRVLSSRVEYRVKGLEQAAELGERFDVILCLGVYYHLTEPLAGLRSVRSLLEEGGRVYLEGMYLPGRVPIVRFFEPNEVEPITYCAATIPGLLRMGDVSSRYSAPSFRETFGTVGVAR